MPPERSWIRLNTDCAAKGIISGCGGVLWGENKGWICGFLKGFDVCSAYVGSF
jgi:hypothetical protein